MNQLNRSGAGLKPLKWLASRLPVPPTLRTVTEDVVVRPAGTREEPLAPIFKTTSEQLTTREAATRVKVLPATYRTEMVRVVDVLVVVREVGECVRAGGVGAAVDVEVLAGGRVVEELFGAEDVDELEELEELVVVGGLGGATPGFRPAPKARPIAWPGAGFRLAAPELL